MVSRYPDLQQAVREIAEHIAEMRDAAANQQDARDYAELHDRLVNSAQTLFRTWITFRAKHLLMRSMPRSIMPPGRGRLLYGASESARFRSGSTNSPPRLLRSRESRRPGAAAQ